MVANGSGWMRNRYQASLCASNPQPCSWTPSISEVKSLMSTVCAVTAGVGGLG